MCTFMFIAYILYTHTHTHTHIYIYIFHKKEWNLAICVTTWIDLRVYYVSEISQGKANTV